jgi:hypothetical protein
MAGCVCEVKDLIRGVRVGQHLGVINSVTTCASKHQLIPPRQPHLNSHEPGCAAYCV